MKNKGFTLIEVLIALIILAIALTAAVFAVQTSIRNTDRIHDKLSAHWIAMNVISSMQVGLISPPTDSVEDGESTMLNKTYTWTAGIDQKSNGAYERIYVDVSLKETTNQLEHLIGFLPIQPTKSASIKP
jgi:general secretion pathway protein I